MLDAEKVISRVTIISKTKGQSPTAAMIAAGVGKDFFYNLRNHPNPSIVKIKKLADYFEVSLEDIIGDNEFMPINANKDAPEGVPNISEAEAELLDLYRKLPDRSRDRVMGFALSEAQREETGE